MPCEVEAKTEERIKEMAWYLHKCTPEILFDKYTRPPDPKFCFFGPSNPRVRDFKPNTLGG